MSETYVYVGGMRNGKSYHRALNMAQTIMQEYPNQSVCVISLDDYKKALADERAKTIEEMDQTIREIYEADATRCLFDCPRADEPITCTICVLERAVEQMKGVKNDRAD